MLAVKESAGPGAPPLAPVPILRVEHLSRRFGAGRADVLRDVSFDLLPNQSFGVAAANGAGKTVLMRLLAALDRPTSGRVTVAGFDTVRNAGAVRRFLGYLPEGAVGYAGLSVLQYLAFVGRGHGLVGAARAATADTLLEVVGLEALAHRDVGDLSPGERRRLLLAGALVHEPRLLVLDDPMRGLDEQSRREQQEVLRELRGLGTSMVVAATRPDDLLDLCDVIAVLREGQLVWSGTPEDAGRLAEPGLLSGIPVRLEVPSGRDQAADLLRQRRDVSELEADADGATLWFRFSGDHAALGSVIPQLLRADCVVTHFGFERRSPAAAIAALFRASAPITPPWTPSVAPAPLGRTDAEQRPSRTA